MSNIYIQEPPPDGKVCLETTAGDIDIELWSREAPKACRNFVQLCLEGYYDGTIFHRMVKGFIVQGGDPTGTGTGGNSIWGKTFKDEFHSRLRFMRRGLVAMANAGRDDNGSQFFFTLGATPELQNKHTIFAKVGGNTIYNMLKLEEGLTDENEKPLYPHKIVKTKVLSNPFSDIVPRETIKKVKDDKKDKNKSKAAATKNYKLLSFGEEAEEDEEEVDEVNKRYSGKSKSMHDLANDPKLSSEPAVDTATATSKKQKDKSAPSSESASSDSDDASKDHESRHKKKKQKPSSDASDEDKEKIHRKKKDVENVRDKLKRKEEKSPKKDSESKSSDKKTESGVSKKEDDDDGEYYLGKEEKMEQKRKVEALRKEYKELRRSIKQEQKVEEKEAVTASKEAEEKAAKLAADNNVIKEFMDEQEKYKQVKAKAPKKGDDREALTLAMLAKFKSKIETAKETFEGKELPPPPSSSSKKKKDGKLKEGEDTDEDEEPDDISWLARKLQNENKDEVLAKDANKKSDDWFDIYDPRNALTKRRREQAKDDSKEKKRARINN